MSSVGLDVHDLNIRLGLIKFLFYSEPLQRPPAKKRCQVQMDRYLHQPVRPSQATKITKLIMNVIVGDLRPINLVEGENFKLLIEHLAPGYDLPSRMTFTRQLDNMLVKCKRKITSILSKAHHISITSDLWSSVRQQSYVGVTAHCLDANMEVQTFVLATKQVVNSHTGENVAEWIESVIADYSISPDQIFAVVTDNGTNMVRACDMLHNRHHWKHIRCSAHTLQLCIKDACALSFVKSAIGAARHLVLYFKQSHKAAEALRSLQQHGDDKLELILDVPNRWNSTYSMIARLCQMQWMVRQVISNTAITSRSKASQLEIRDTHWIFLQELVQELLPFKVATDFIEGDKYITIAGVIPVIKGLLNHCGSRSCTTPGSAAEQIRNFRSTLKSSLETRFIFALRQETDLPSVFDMATWLHPFYKEKYYKKDFAAAVRLQIQSEILMSNPSVSTSITAPSTTTTTTGATAGNKLQNLLSLGVEESSTEDESSDEAMDIQSAALKEISQYVKEKSTDCDVLKYWSTKQKVFPMLHTICVKYFSTPASSASSERCFSSAGLTATALRSRLSGSHLEALNILHCNKHLLE